MPDSSLKLSEIVERVAEKTQQPNSVVKAILKAEQEVIADELAKGNDVSGVNGTVKFSVAERAARTGRNPQTGETMNIPAKKVVKAKVGKKLQNVVG